MPEQETDVRLGMMQPYFFPYPGYFALIEATDEWVVFDTPQYIRRGWVNRNRVLSSGTVAWKYLRVPVCKASRSTSIRCIRITDRTNLASEICNSLTDYKHWRAPFYSETLDLIQACLSIDTDDLTQLLLHCLTCTCEYLSIEFKPRLFSDMNVNVPNAPHPGDWARLTAVHVGADEYINPPGGRDLFSPAAFEAAGVRLSILQHRIPHYPQGPRTLQTGLSIIDTMMWNGPSVTRELVRDYELTSMTSAVHTLPKSA